MITSVSACGGVLTLSNPFGNLPGFLFVMVNDQHKRLQG
jgi:hypothetical protein